MSLLNNIKQCMDYIDEHEMKECRVVHMPSTPFDDKYKGFGVLVCNDEQLKRMTIDEFMEMHGLKEK